jgi:uncharacterized protein YqeY
VADTQGASEPITGEEITRHHVPPGSLKARLVQEQRAAMKSSQKVRLSALRMLSAAVTNREVEVGRPLSDPEFVEVATREVKRRKEAAEAFAGAGRQDRADTEREEQRVLEEFVPAGMSEAEADALVDEAISATGATGPGDLGKVMSYVMGKAKGRVDGKAVQTQVRARLGG